MLLDIRDILRSFRRDLAYPLAVVLTLALTVGSTTAVFSIVNGVLLRPLPYPDARRLVAIRETWRELAHQSATLEVNERHAEYWREHARSFAGIAQFTLLPANLTGPGEATQVTIAKSNGSLFDVLGVEAAVGRTLLPADDRQGAGDVAVISSALWRQRFGADPGAVGRSVVLDGHPHTIVGILPSDFVLPRIGRLTASVDVFVPLHSSADWIGQVGWVGDHNNDAIGRLRAGTTMEQARSEIELLQRQVSVMASDQAHEPVTLGAVLTPLADSVVGQSRQALLVLLASILSVLLIACTNLANLSLSRTIGGIRDMAVRAALGAGRGRLIGRAVLEQLMLAGAGGAIGLGLASVALAIFVRTAGIELPRVDDVRMDGRVLAFAFLVSALAGLAVALLPAWRIAAQDVESTLRSGSGAVASERGGLRLRAALLTVQVAMAVMLLVVTGLLTVSFMRLLGVDRGFSTEHVAAIDVSLPANRYADGGARLAMYDRILQSVRALPGVSRAATTSMLPLTGQGQVNFIVPEGSTTPRAEQASANFRFVAPEFAETLGIRLLRGRWVRDNERDGSRPAPVLISESTAVRMWPGQDPIGKRFSRGNAGEQAFEVVGVLADARMTSLDRTPPYMVYVPYWWRSYPMMSLVVRTAADPLAVVPSVRRAIREIDPEVAVAEARPLERLVESSLAVRRRQSQLFLVFGAMALFIATVGVYAVTSYGVSRRRREMNIRAALGAQPRQVVAMILRQSGRPVAIGLAAGGLGAVGIGRLVSSLLFGISARDPYVLVGTVGLVGATGFLAAAVAARRGLSLDPAAALRDQ